MADERRVAEEQETRYGSGVSQQHRPTQSMLRGEQLPDADEVPQMQQRHDGMMRSHVERVQGQPLRNPLGGHQQQPHRRPAMPEIQLRGAKEVLAVDDRGVAVVEVDVDEIQAGHQPRANQGDQRRPDGRESRPRVPRAQVGHGYNNGSGVVEWRNARRSQRERCARPVTAATRCLGRNGFIR